MANQVTSADGQKLTVKYQEGEKIIIVPPTAEIVTYKKAAADLKPGQKIFVAAAKKLPDGTLEAPNVAFGDYGVWRSARTGIGTPSTSHRAPPFENAALRPLVKALLPLQLRGWHVTALRQGCRLFPRQHGPAGQVRAWPRRAAPSGHELLDGGRWTLVAEFTEVESGKRDDNRPQLAAAIAACKREKAKLVIAKLDRAATWLSSLRPPPRPGPDPTAVPKRRSCGGHRA